MKKFLKVFSVLMLICCMFTFAGCAVKDNDGNEYEGLVKERNYVREVLSNTEEFLQSVTIGEDAVAATSANVQSGSPISNPDINVRANGYDWARNSVKELSGILGAISAVINNDGFVPGKLYNAEITEELGDGGTYSFYILLNAYCGEDGVVTLNYSITESKDNMEYATDSLANAIDIYCNKDGQPIRFVGCESSSDYAEFKDMRFTDSGKFESCHISQDYETFRRMVDVDKDGEITDYCEYANDPTSECFTDEMNETFDSEIEFAKERTCLYSFARPMSKEALDKFVDAMERSETE